MKKKQQRQPIERSANEVRAFLTTHLATLLRVAPEAIDGDRTFTDFGLDSLEAVNLSAELSDWLGVDLDANLVWEQPTIHALAGALGHDAGKATASAPEAKLHLERPVVEPQHRFDMLPEYLELREQIDEIESAGMLNPFHLTRDGVLAGTCQIGGVPCVSFCGYNYLGLAGDPAVADAAVAAIRAQGTSASASRVVGGDRAVHRALEAAIAALVGAEAALAFVSGHATNVSTIATLVGPGDLVIHDALAHDSLVQGIRLSGARPASFPHNDLDRLDALLSRHRPHNRRALVAIEGLYSADGDIPDVPRIAAIAHRHKAWLMVDEAHTIGTVGKRGGGVRELFDMAAHDVDIWMGTLSKAFASAGGYIAGSRQLVELLRYRSPGYVYAAAMPPSNAAAALAAIEALAREPERVATLHARTAVFQRKARELGLDLGPLHPQSPVVPVIVGDGARCMRLSAALLERDIDVAPLVPPIVPEGSARLRFFISAAHTEEQLVRAAMVTAEELGRLGG